MTEELIGVLRASKAHLTLFHNKFLKTSEDEQLFVISDNVASTIVRIDNILLKMPREKDGITIDDVIGCVCAYYHISEQEMLKRGRKNECVVPRQMVMYFCREIISRKYLTKEIGARLNGLHHATILYGAQTIKNYLDTDEGRRRDFYEIKELIETIYNGGAII